MVNYYQIAYFCSLLSLIEESNRIYSLRREWGEMSPLYSPSPPKLKKKKYLKKKIKCYYHPTLFFPFIPLNPNIVTEDGRPSTYINFSTSVAKRWTQWIPTSLFGCMEGSQTSPFTAVYNQVKMKKQRLSLLINEGW